MDGERGSVDAEYCTGSRQLFDMNEVRRCFGEFALESEDIFDVGREFELQAALIHSDAKLASE